MSKKYSFKAKVSKFNMLDGWHFVAVPTDITNEKTLALKLEVFKGWKFLPISVKIGKTTWETSLLPLGKHSVEKNQKFIAIKKDVRKKENIFHGDEVGIIFKIR